MAQQRKVTATDFSVFGNVDANGTLLPLNTQDAIENAFRMWAVSSKGEIIRNPRRGGFLLPWITKPLSEENADEIRSAILDGLDQDFTPFIEITRVDVVPNYIERQWDIEVIGFCQEYKTEVSTSVSLAAAGA